ncbi:hypothetical protein [Streptomyces cacaoi]|uniref:hypothetical protein n=1 Tax=Streptomyces cacaoi TaxID=1898 RepID=UPI0026199E24|nr:hypothetical protein [Streptomyces cacaoi]
MSTFLEVSMSDRLPPTDEAARALRDVEQQRSRSRASTRESRWVSVVFGLVIFAQLAAPDFFGDRVRPWASWAVVVLLLAYQTMLRTRRGSALLGRPTRVRREEISPRFTAAARITILLVLVAGFALALFLDGPPFPYMGTALGVVLGGTLIFFGGTLQQSLNSLATRGPRDMPGAVHGSH